MFSSGLYDSRLVTVMTAAAQTNEHLLWVVTSTSAAAVWAFFQDLENFGGLLGICCYFAQQSWNFCSMILRFLERGSVSAASS